MGTNTWYIPLKTAHILSLTGVKNAIGQAHIRSTYTPKGGETIAKITGSIYTEILRCKFSKLPKMYFILKCISIGNENQVPLGVTKLAKDVGCSPANMSYTVLRLKELGILNQHMKGTNKFLVLTEIGKEVLLGLEETLEDPNYVRDISRVIRSNQKRNKRREIESAKKNTSASK